MTVKKVVYSLIMILSVLIFIELNCTDWWDYVKPKEKDPIVEKKKKDCSKKEVIYEEDVIPEVSEYVKKYNNKDIKGVLYIPNTDIMEPIVQADDNDYYLNRDLKKKRDSRGSVFLDYRVEINEGRKNLIYSHNSSIHDVPFKELEDYYDKDYYEGHKYIYLKDNDKTYKYLVFSVYVETSDWTYTKTKFKNDNEWLKHIEELKKKSWYDTGIILDKKDQVLILQTCSHHKKYKNYKDKYLLVIAKRIA